MCLLQWLILIDRALQGQQGIEYLMALTAAYLAIRHIQLIGSNPKHAAAVQAGGMHFFVYRFTIMHINVCVFRSLGTSRREF